MKTLNQKEKVIEKMYMVSKYEQIIKQVHGILADATGMINQMISHVDDNLLDSFHDVILKGYNMLNQINTNEFVGGFRNNYCAYVKIQPIQMDNLDIEICERMEKVIKEYDYLMYLFDMR